MASLVTLGSAPYNPYNTSFAGIALQGLGMAQGEMNQRDQIAQASYQNYMKSVQFGADLLFKGQEMQLAKRKMDFMVDQSMFERKMAVEEMAFKKEQAAESGRRFDAGLKIDERRTNLAEERFNFDKTVYDDAAPVRDLQTTNSAIQAMGNLQSLQWAQEDRPLGIRTREIQNATALANTAIGFQNADTSALNAETNAQIAENRSQQLQQYDKQKAAAIRAYDSQIKQKDGQIASAEREVIRQQAEIRGSDKKTTPALQKAEEQAARLRREKEELEKAKFRFETQGGTATQTAPVDEDTQRVDDFLYRRRHGVDASLFPANNGVSPYD